MKIKLLIHKYEYRSARTKEYRFPWLYVVFSTNYWFAIWLFKVCNVVSQLKLSLN